MAGIHLIAGLGNPGGKYQKTRHNAGVWFVELLANQYGGSLQAESKFFGQTCCISIAGHDCRLLLPSTFMNNSGKSIAALANYFKIPVDSIFVAHDELDLPAGKSKLKLGGGHAGHRGLKDIMACLGGEGGFPRLRIGIGHPGHKDKVLAYVLKPPPAAEQEAIEQVLGEASSLITEIVTGNWAKAQNQLHSFAPS